MLFRSGARIWNASVASGIPVHEYAAEVDALMFCFSKGLGAPVGSIVCGPADLIAEIRYLRKRLGGGMRQAGVIAAAARVALAERERLVEDHLLARRLGEAIAERFPPAVDPSLVETNMVRVHFPALGVAWVELKERLDGAGVKVNPPLGGALRIVTHRDVDSADVTRLLSALA